MDTYLCSQLSTTFDDDWKQHYQKMQVLLDISDSRTSGSQEAGLENSNSIHHFSYISNISRENATGRCTDMPLQWIDRQIRSGHDISVSFGRLPILSEQSNFIAFSSVRTKQKLRSTTAKPARAGRSGKQTDKPVVSRTAGPAALAQFRGKIEEGSSSLREKLRRSQQRSRERERKRERGDPGKRIPRERPKRNVQLQQAKRLQERDRNTGAGIGTVSFSRELRFQDVFRLRYAQVYGAALTPRDDPQ